jgi:hypothetical protein
MINNEQLKELKKIQSESDRFVGSPTYLAMDDDGDLRSYIGKPSKDKGDKYWQGIPFTSYDETTKNILNFIQIGHKKPFDINELIENSK